MSETPYSTGDIVIDSDDDDPSKAVVVSNPEEIAEDWKVVAIDETVAEDNPGYPSDAPVLLVAFKRELEQTFPDWEGHLPIACGDMYANGLTFYSFPSPRLEATGETYDSDTEPEPEPETKQLAERLEDGGMSTEIEPDGETIVAEKLGTEYRVRPGTVIDGSGPLRTRLESIVKAV